MCTAIIDWVKSLNSAGIGNLITSGTAIVAIVGLILQSRSTRKQTKLQNFIEYTKRYQEIILNFPENVNENDFQISNLPEDTKNKTMRYMRAYFDLCFEEYTLYKKKYIDQGLWSIWQGGIKKALSKPAFQQAWEKIQTDSTFGDEFENFIKQEKA